MKMVYYTPKSRSVNDEIYIYIFKTFMADAHKMYNRCLQNVKRNVKIYWYICEIRRCNNGSGRIEG